MAVGTDTLKRTPLYDRHVAAGAKLVPFAGWEMPVQYAGIKDEHLTVRPPPGSSTSRTWARSRPPGRTPRRSCSASSPTTSRKIAEHGAQYSVLCKEDGGVLDDLFTYRLDDDRFLTVTNASNHEKDLAWFRKQAEPFDVTLHDRLHDYAMLAVQGPEARGIVAGLTDGELPKRFRTARADRRRRARRARLRHRLHGRGRRRAARRARARRQPSGTRSSRPAPSPQASARATRCAWRSASTSTATT